MQFITQEVLTTRTNSKEAYQLRKPDREEIDLPTACDKSRLTFIREISEFSSQAFRWSLQQRVEYLVGHKESVTPTVSCYYRQLFYQIQQSINLK